MSNNSKDNRKRKFIETEDENVNINSKKKCIEQKINGDNSNKKLSQENKKLKEKIIELENENKHINDNFQKTKNSLGDEIDLLNEEIEKIYDEKHSLKKDIDEYIKEINSYKYDNLYLYDRTKQLKKELEEIKSENKNNLTEITPEEIFSKIFVLNVPGKKDKDTNNDNNKENITSNENNLESIEEEEDDNESIQDDEDWEYKLINRNINSIEDLIEIGMLYDKTLKVKYNINIKKLNKLVEPLQKLNTMVGMEKVKQSIVDLILYFLQGIDDKNNDMLHCVIEGPPGVGKTEVAKILGQIYRKMGILSNDKFKSVKRSDLIGGYLGQTAIKTQKVLDECKGGVLFIDEAYSLGNSEGKDSYSKECIDTLTAYLSENKQNFICIIAGYKDSLKQCFFKYNEGLERRFPYRFEIDEYNPEELSKIFLKIVKENNWSTTEFDVSFFEKNKEYFTFNGGDMELLFHKCKIAHSKRVFCLEKKFKKILNTSDLDEGLKLLLNNNEIAKRKEKINTWCNMYT